MRTWIKICGLTRREDASRALRLGADALGLVLTRESKRSCAPDVARTIVCGLPAEATTVGVWFKEGPEKIAEMATFVGCKYVQTYSAFSARMLQAWGFSVIPAIPVEKNASTVGDDWKVLCKRWDGRIVLDHSAAIRTGSPSMSIPCGTWTDAKALMGTTAAQIVLAGGLAPETVRQVLDVCRPAGVDVASGVESIPGRKDPEKIMNFIREVRLWDKKAGSVSSADSLSLKP